MPYCLFLEPTLSPVHLLTGKINHEGLKFDALFRSSGRIREPVRRVQKGIQAYFGTVLTPIIAIPAVNIFPTPLFLFFMMCS